ncbi:MAG TPA: S4 domain-containing protein, partial [Burkholderiales bacterium]|nr:S4 domain-containing protein [Burkholderiales bacterium]
MRKKNHNTDPEWDAALAAPMSTNVPSTLGGMRLDQALARLFPQYSRNRLQAWLKSGNITVDGRRLSSDHAVTGGEAV